MFDRNGTVAMPESERDMNGPLMAAVDTDPFAFSTGHSRNTGSLGYG